MNKKREKPLPAGPAVRVEDRRRREYESLLAIISSSRDIIYSAGLDGKIVYASPRV